MRLISLIFGTLLLSGCDKFSEIGITEICEQYPQMCEDLNSDAWCRAEKSKIIKNRYNNLKQPSDGWKYELLLNFEEYKQCIAKASQIEHIKLKEKKSGRVAGLITADKELRKLARDTQESKDPRLLYYHWSRFGSEEHLKEFLAYRDSELLESPEMQIALATYYVKNDREKTIQTLYHALELYRANDEIDSEIFNSLTSIFVKLEDYPKAFIWGYIAREFKVEKLDLSQIEALVRQTGGNIGALEDTADDYVDAIKSGEFRAPN
ncbi:DUF2989 domain-containing protein [Paraneptunicella aestuarii]|uniref:DUF2989 domain-containing protein n=1 Tax=Paraneptunicella aestuarii TaxID=2831148 RepID=UPI001E5D5AF9|nr:DUF2989 domain-containing protein [Paraneptunicella aestuarii]UAA40431.1 DUF2989 domain-containing protein [Paraneptunicella aestuarii]